MKFIAFVFCSTLTIHMISCESDNADALDSCSKSVPYPIDNVAEEHIKTLTKDVDVLIKYKECITQIILGLNLESNDKDAAESEATRCLAGLMTHYANIDYKDLKDDPKLLQFYFCVKDLNTKNILHPFEVAMSNCNFDLTKGDKTKKDVHACIKENI